MDPEFVTLFFALLSVALFLSIGALIVDLATGDTIGIARALQPLALPLAAAVATTSMLGSLYLSEVAGYKPCTLCWVQRIFMYPAALFLIIALLTKQSALKWGALALAVPGLAVALFHRYEQYVGESGTFCDVANPCSNRYVNALGFITVPTMAAVGFAGIIALVLLTTRKAA